MKKIILFAGSNSSKSINQQLVTYTASLMGDQDAHVIDLREYDAPIYSSDIEEGSGIPAQIQSFKNLISESDGIVISLAEHNGNMTAFFKNIMDWLSRAEMKAFADKPVLLMSSSPGARGGQSALEFTTKIMGYMGAKIEHSFSLGSFYDKFDMENLALKEGEDHDRLEAAVEGFLGQLANA